MNSDFDVEIGTGAERGSYQVRVVHSGVDVESLGTLQLDVEGLVRRRDELEAKVLSSAVRARRTATTELPVRQVGEELFKALFTGEVYGAYRASLGLAQRSGKQLRVVLRLGAPELAALPWEALFDPETKRYLCKNEPLVRHVPAPYTPSPLETNLPLRVLGLVASPRNLQPLDVEAEQRRLSEALAEPIAAGRVELVWLPNATWAAVHDRLLAGKWHALHFIGHGDFDAAREEGVLALVGEEGLADMVSASQLADLLTQARPPLHLVVLNSCSSGEAGAHDLFSGTAAALAHSGITAVAAMQYAVSDKAAIAFARGFYAALAWGRNVDEAACSGRISILGTRDTLEWVTPVLYLRGGATQVFAFTGREPPPPPAVPDPGHVKIRAKAEHRALYVEARAESRVGNYETAIGLLDDLLSLDPQYPDAASLRDTARRSKQLADTYRAAREAEDAGDWAGAASAYAEVLQTDSGYRDALARKNACEARQRVADLQAELRIHAASGQWQAILDVDAEIRRLEPSSADPDGLATQARQELAAKPLRREQAAEVGQISGQPFGEGATEKQETPRRKESASMRQAEAEAKRMAEEKSGLQSAEAEASWRTEGGHQEGRPAIAQGEPQAPEGLGGLKWIAIIVSIAFVLLILGALIWGAIRY